MSYSSIPTAYKGINMRSRLEARWAWMFDAMGVRWEYEPIDCAGWIPDFRLWPEGCSPVLVEIKPVSEFPQDVAKKVEAAAPISADGRARTSEHDSILILGSGPFRSISDPDTGGHGLEPSFARAVGWNLNGAGCMPVLMGVRRNGFKGNPQLNALYFCIISGDIALFRIAPVFGEVDRLDFAMDGGAHVDALWREAGNAVQWKGRNG